MRTVLITGSTGMVGRNVIKKLVSLDLVIISPSKKELDLKNIYSLDEYLLKIKPDIIIHCAGLVGGIHANIDAPYDFCFDNLQMGLNLIESSNRNNVQYLINLGSSCMYPRNAVNPLNESQILTGELEPTNEGYAVAKIAVAKLCEFMNKQHERCYKTLIPCNLYGIGDDFTIGKSHMIPGVIHRMHEAKENGDETMTIWGNGKTRREFMFVEELANFLLVNIHKIDQWPQNMNIGIGVDYSINEYYRAIAKIVGFEGDFVHDLSKPEGMKEKLVDITEQKKLGWESDIGLLEGITKTYEYYLEMKK